MAGEDTESLAEGSQRGRGKGDSHHPHSRVLEMESDLPVPGWAKRAPGLARAISLLLPPQGLLPCSVAPSLRAGGWRAQGQPEEAGETCPSLPGRGGGLLSFGPLVPQNGLPGDTQGTNVPNKLRRKAKRRRLTGKESACHAGDQVRSLGQEDPLEEGVATHSSLLAWRIPWTEETGGLQPTGLQRVGHD